MMNKPMAMDANVVFNQWFNQLVEFNDYKHFDLFKKCFYLGFDEGNKEHKNSVWHDLQKDLDDTPSLRFTSDGEAYAPLVLVFFHRSDDFGKQSNVYALDRYSPEVGKWDCYWQDKIIAWAELPKPVDDDSNDYDNVPMEFHKKRRHDDNTGNITQKRADHITALEINEVTFRSMQEILVYMNKLRDENKSLKESSSWHYLKDNDYPEHHKEIVCKTEIGLYLGMYDKTDNQFYDDRGASCIKPVCWSYVNAPNIDTDGIAFD